MERRNNSALKSHARLLCESVGGCPHNTLDSSTKVVQPAAPDRIAYSIEEGAALIGASRTFLYEQIKAGKLRSHKCARRRFVFPEDLVDLVTNAQTTDPGCSK